VLDEPFKPVIDDPQMDWLAKTMKEEDDTFLTARKIAALTAFAAIALVGGWQLMFPPKPIPLNLANGSYANNRCGIISFVNGTATWNDDEANYTLETDKIGMFALTNYLVGTKATEGSCSISSDRSKYPLKLRFDNESHPTVVTLSDMDRSAEIDFSRQPARRGGS